MSRLQWSAPPSRLSTRAARSPIAGALSCATKQPPLLIQFSGEDSFRTKTTRSGAASGGKRSVTERPPAKGVWTALASIC